MQWMLPFDPDDRTQRTDWLTRAIELGGEVHDGPHAIVAVFPRVLTVDEMCYVNGER